MARRGVNGPIGCRSRRCCFPGRLYDIGHGVVRVFVTLIRYLGPSNRYSVSITIYGIPLPLKSELSSYSQMNKSRCSHTDPEAHDCCEDFPGTCCNVCYSILYRQRLPMCTCPPLLRRVARGCNGIKSSRLISKFTIRFTLNVRVASK